MNEPTPEQVSAAQRLGISLRFYDAPLTVARLVEIVEELQRRVEALERERQGWLSRKAR